MCITRSKGQVKRHRKRKRTVDKEEMRKGTAWVADPLFATKRETSRRTTTKRGVMRKRKSKLIIFLGAKNFT